MYCKLDDVTLVDVDLVFEGKECMLPMGKLAER
jgi:hypothetical protein